MLYLFCRIVTSSPGSREGLENGESGQQHINYVMSPERSLTLHLQIKAGLRWRSTLSFVV
jgi:hypothetical protein